ncbi:MAG: hypothetical protein JKY02_04825 [Flavobacteriaceae bacterium]|nr:hypothetical protein [Flavobacteriaceae bacterium]
MKSIYPFLIVLFFSFSLPSTAQQCEILKNGSFTYKLAKKKVLVYFKENKHVEYHQDKKYYIKSSIEWVSDCEYYLVIEGVTLPNFPFKIGSRLHIKITKVKGNRVYYKSSMAGRTWEGKMTKAK